MICFLFINDDKFYLRWIFWNLSFIGLNVSNVCFVEPFNSEVTVKIC